MRYVGLLFSVFVLCLLPFLEGCAPTIPKGQEYKVEDKKEDKNTYLNSIRHLPWGEEKIELLDKIHSIRILDQKVYEEMRVLNPLDSVYDKPKIDSLWENYWTEQDLKWAPHTPYINERGDEFRKRLAYVKQRGFTTPGLHYLEKPAEFILRLGIRDDEWKTWNEPCGITGREAKGTEIPCEHLYMQFLTPQGVIMVAFEPDEDGEYNTVLHQNMAKEGKGALQKVAVTEHKVLTATPKLDIYPGIEWIKTYVDISAFPNSFSTAFWTVFISIGIPSNELLKLRVGDSVYVKIILVVYDSKDSVVVNESLFLDISTSLLEDGTWFPVYIHVLLPQGRYVVAAAISSLDGGKLSVHRIPKDIPPSLSGMGDILISAVPLPVVKDSFTWRGAWTSDGILRPGGFVPNYPFGLPTGETLRFCIEPRVSPDSDGIRRYGVEFFLLPTEGKRKGEVELGEPEYFFEEEGAEMIKEGLLAEEVEIKRKGEIKLFSRRVETKNPYSVFDFPISDFVEDGEYNLVVAIEHYGKKDFDFVWRLVKIKQTKVQ